MLFKHQMLWAALAGSAVAAGGSAFAQDTDVAALQKEIQALKTQLSEVQKNDQSLHARVTDLEAKEGAGWMTQHRTDEIRAVVESALADAKQHNETTTGLNLGYDRGFFLQSDDQAARLQANGLFDVRYTYARAENEHQITGTPLGTARNGDMSGISLTNAQLALSGYVFHNIIFKAMGNFGALSSSTGAVVGTFQVNELWGGYKFSDELNIRAGSLITPIIPLKTLTNNGGLQFPDIPEVSLPFGAGYQLGVDVYGQLLDHRLSYDVLFGNGSSSQNNVDSTIPDGGRDNRFALYTREQFAGSGKLSDFDDVPDLQDHQNLVWIIGAGAGYESQNNATNAFPGSQTTTGITGLSTDPSPGFLNSKYVLDGDLYRGAADFRMKYRGFSLYSEVLYQRINGAGTVIPDDPSSSVGQLGYFVQAGYFLVPKRLDVAGRFGELFTLGLPNRMDEVALGLDYYLFGENAKIQCAEEYIPDESAVTSGTGTIVNTRDFITEVQFQVKF